ncbi:ABC transporter permease [Candidatus Wolfebacteria bacterium]|nr:ABC transporter permease [Candidatus Wolfebacteria bacterium]
MFKNFLVLILKGIRYRPIRSWLTILGIIIGIMLVVIIMSLSDGIKNAIGKTLQMFGSDLIIVRPGKETNPFAEFIGGRKFKEKDLIDLEKIEGVDFVVPMEVASLNIEYKGEKKSALFHAQNWTNYVKVLEASQGFKLVEGVWPKNENFKEIVLGNKAAQNLFKEKVRVGDEIIIKTKRFKIAGYLSAIGEQMSDNVVYISMNVFRDLTGNRGFAMAALVKTKPGANVNLISQTIKYQLSKQEAGPEFSVLMPEKAGQIISSVISIVELTLTIIALVSLIVGAVGITNTMYTSVLERTKQIGIIKAVGASRDAILSLFLIESGIIGLIGGILGIIFGIIFAYFVSLFSAYYFGLGELFSFASIDFFGLSVILIITFITGIIAGVLPARQAAMMEPAEALRYE